MPLEVQGNLDDIRKEKPAGAVRYGTSRAADVESRADLIGWGLHRWDASPISALRGRCELSEIPIEVEQADLNFAARGYDRRRRSAGSERRTARSPARVRENGIIGQLNPGLLEFFAASFLTATRRC